MHGVVRLPQENMFVRESYVTVEVLEREEESKRKFNEEFAEEKAQTGKLGQGKSKKSRQR